MLKIRFYLYAVLAISLVVLLLRCNDDNRDNKETIRNLENNIKSLEDGAKVKTFPLTIIISDKLTGEVMPANLQQTQKNYLPLNQRKSK